MKLRTCVVLFLVVLTAGVASSVASSAAVQHKPAPKKADAIAGEWDAAFYAEDNATPLTLTLKLARDGDKVTGSYESSDHLGSGEIVNGSWVANKLSLALKTSHGTIALKGVLKDGKLAGDFDAGQMQGRWEAHKK